MTKLIVVGAGGHAAEINDYIGHGERKSGIGQFNIQGFIDDNPDSYSRYSLSGPFLGTIADHAIRADCKYLLAIGSPDSRRRIVERFLSLGASFASLIHADAHISDSAHCGVGVVIAPNANIGPNVEVGSFTLVNARASIGHDSIVGRFNNLCPNVCLSGFTVVGDDNLFGINCATIPGIRVGNRNKFAAGMVISSDIEDDNVVFYRYKERVLVIPKERR